MELQSTDGGGFSGKYNYVGRSASIPLTGAQNNGAFEIDEYDPSHSGMDKDPIATMSLILEGDAFIGKWVQKNRSRTFDILLTRRIY